MHSIDSIHTYAYGTSKDLLSEEENKCNNIKKKKKMWLTLMIFKRKHKRT